MENSYVGLYMWHGKGASGNRYLYVGIVGTKAKLSEKQSIASRLKQHESYYKKGLENGHNNEKIEILQFRYDILVNYPENLRVELLKTAEMRVITSLTSLIPCDFKQRQVTALISNMPGINYTLLNKKTAYHHKK